MRREKFHMERDVLKVGDCVKIREGTLPFSYYYIAGDAAAMSGNYKASERILSSEGTVVEIGRQDSTYVVYIEFEN
ncbi:MAG: hypothetical protein ACI4C1_06660 [Lachnospiraceae bacterium]